MSNKSMIVFLKNSMQRDKGLIEKAEVDYGQ
jgi:hypothetical protein